MITITLDTRRSKDQLNLLALPAGIGLIGAAPALVSQSPACGCHSTCSMPRQVRRSRSRLSSATAGCFQTSCCSAARARQPAATSTASIR